MDVIGIGWGAISLLLTHLRGVYRLALIVTICIAAGIGIFLSYKGWPIRRNTVISFLLLVVGLYVIVLGSLIWIKYLNRPIFIEDEPGILIARIQGDTDTGFQRDLHRSLENELDRIKQQDTSARISLMIDEWSAKPVRTHLQAKSIGKKHKATVVIWGDRIDEWKFHPRVRIIPETRPKVLRSGEFSIPAQDMRSHLELPVTLVQYPTFLASYVFGYFLYKEKKYNEAIPYFRHALRSSSSEDANLNSLRLQLGYCISTVYSGSASTAGFHEEVELYNTVLHSYSYSAEEFDIALVYQLRGSAYHNLSKVNKSPYEDLARSDFLRAEELFTNTERTLSHSVNAQLGVLYAELASLVSPKYYVKAQKAFADAREHYSRKDYPEEWAGLTFNIALLMANESAEKHDGTTPPDIAREIIALLDETLEIYNRDTDPVQWARVQHSLGTAYLFLQSENEYHDASKAIEHYRLAEEILTQKKYYHEWEALQRNLHIASLRAVGSIDMGPEGTVLTWIYHQNENWATDTETYKFPQLGGVPQFSLTKLRNGTLYVEVLGLYPIPIGFSMPMPVPVHTIPGTTQKGIHVAFTWGKDQITMYIDGEIAFTLRDLEFILPE